MKRSITAILFVLLFSSACIANGKDTDIQLQNILKVVIKYANRAEWITTDNFKKVSFTYKGKELQAYYDAENKLIAFSADLSLNELPKEALETITKKFCDCVISDVVIFLHADGQIDYFAGIKISKMYIALKVMPNGKVKVFQKIRLQ